MTADDAGTPAADGPEVGDLDISQLAAASGYTVRNIRAYLQMGLLTAGRKVGRKLYFDADHLERLEWIAECRQRGYSLPAIKDIISGTIHMTDGEVDDATVPPTIDLTTAGVEPKLPSA